jgi:hypothetical protein
MKTPVERTEPTLWEPLEALLLLPDADRAKLGSAAAQAAAPAAPLLLLAPSEPAAAVGAKALLVLGTASPPLLPFLLPRLRLWLLL